MQAQPSTGFPWLGRAVCSRASLQASGEAAGTAPVAHTAQVPLELWLSPRAVRATVAAVTLGRLVLAADRGCSGEAGGAVMHGDPAGAQVEWQIRLS